MYQGKDKRYMVLSGTTYLSGLVPEVHGAIRHNVAIRVRTRGTWCYQAQCSYKGKDKRFMVL